MDHIMGPTPLQTLRGGTPLAAPARMLLPEPERPVVAIVVGLALNSLKFGRRMATGRAPAAANSMSWWGFTGAGNGVRTRDPQLGKLMLYQLSYSRSSDRSSR